MLKKAQPPIKVPEFGKQKMTYAGVGDAAAGSLLADGLKSIFTSNSSKPVTKGDLNEILEKLNARYLLVRNIPQNNLGKHPYYDLIECVIVYL